MSKAELTSLLERLRSETRQLDPAAGAVKERIDVLISDIERHLETDDDAREPHFLRAQLHRLVEQFEVDHPRVTGILNHIIVTLGNMGI